MKKFFRAIRNFFLPPADAKIFIRILPLVVIAVLMLALFVGANFAWEETNTSSFCGLTCHTMPPEHITYLNSAHTNVSCEDCHMGRDRLHVLIPRKIRYSWQTGSAMILNNYEYPIVAKNMAPARQACENCHKPEVFTGDKLVEIRHFAEDEANTPTSTFLAIKIGGGSEREGLGYGIHWHVENVVEYYATDARDQNIPYVKVTGTDGTVTEYVDVESGLDAASVQPEQLKTMDCITCHNRTAHLVDNPVDVMDDLLARRMVSPDIPNIKKKGVQVLSGKYETEQAALDAIAGITNYYSNEQAEFYDANAALVDTAVQAMQDAWKRTNFIDQKVDWQTHPNNLAHKDSPGCFRCHDGKHLSASEEAIRLECNVCHSVPVVSTPDQITATLELSKGFEPESHKNPNWIGLHRKIFDDSCQGCHTVEDPGGASNTSFCSNSACHGASWQFAGFDAPKLREILGVQAEQYVAPSGSSEEEGEQPAAPSDGPLTYATLAGTFKTRCGSCHGATGMKGLNVLDYAKLIAGGESGKAIIPGDPDNSLLYTVQTAAKKHFGQFTADELALIQQWILDGALEK